MRNGLIAGLSALVLAGSCMEAKGSDFSFRFGNSCAHRSWHHSHHHFNTWNSGGHYYYSYPSWSYNSWNPTWTLQPQFVVPQYNTIVVPNYNQMIVPAIPVFPQPTTRFQFSW